MNKIMARMTRMEAEMVIKDQRMAVLEAALDNVNQRIAVLEDSVDSAEESMITNPANTTEDTEDTFSHNFLPTNRGVELPPELEVVWFPFFEGIQRACRDIGPWNTDWSKSSDSVEANIGMTAEQFYQEAPCKAGDTFEKNGMKGFNGDLYTGYVFGKYNNQTSLILDNLFVPSWGPNNETARADEFMVFYKNMTMPERVEQWRNADITHHWWYKLPQGFSCGKGAPADPTYDFNGYAMDTFTPVPCSEIEVKVLGSGAESCPPRDKKDKYNNIMRPSQPHCWASVGFM